MPNDPLNSKPQPGATSGGRGAAPAWLEDVTRAAQHLTRLSLETAAQAALIVRDASLWAYAGELPQSTAEELAQRATRFYNHNGGSDIARFVRLEGAHRGEYLMYATSLGGDMLLALVFDVSTPFTKIRSQAVRLARALASPPGEEEAARLEEKQPREAPQPEEDPAFERVLRSMPPLLENVPPPIISSQNALVDTQKREAPPPASGKAGKLEGTGPKAEPGSRKPQAEPMPANRDIYTLVHPMEDNREGGQSEAVYTETTRPAMDAAAPSWIALQLACVLIPRIPYHYITGELSASLPNWLAQLCLAYSWKLEYISVRPGYLQWIARVTPSTSPVRHLRVIRRGISRKIFNKFPELANDNPSGDFWAPGYMATASAQPVPGDLLNTYIQRTRRHQGIMRMTS